MNRRWATAIRRVTGSLLAAVVLGCVLGCVPPPVLPPVPPPGAPLVEPPGAPLVAPALPEVPEVRSPRVPTPALLDVRRHALDVTVRVRAVGCTALRNGSGVLLPDGVVATNRHVLGEALEVSVRTWDGRRFDATEPRISNDADLGILQVAEAAPLPSVRIREGAVEPGLAVWVVGSARGEPVTVRPGTVVDILDRPDLNESGGVLRIDVEVRPGHSGGPVLDTEGRLVGLVFAAETDQGTALAVPVESLVERLDTEGFVPPPGC